MAFKGHIPWNKGLRGWTIGTKAGFQKGHKDLVPIKSRKNQADKLKGREFTETHRKNISLNRTGIIFTDKHKENLSNAQLQGKYHKGEKCYFWKGGVTPLNKSIRSSTPYKLWRKSVFERDNYTCVICKAKSTIGRKVYLQADHIKRFSDYPDLRLSISNGRTLCIDCHRKTETYGRK